MIYGCYQMILKPTILQQSNVCVGFSQNYTDFTYFYIDWSHFPINILLVRMKETERRALYGNQKFSTVMRRNTL